MYKVALMSTDVSNKNRQQGYQVFHSPVTYESDRLLSFEHYHHCKLVFKTRHLTNQLCLNEYSYPPFLNTPSMLQDDLDSSYFDLVKDRVSIETLRFLYSFPICFIFPSCWYNLLMLIAPNLFFRCIKLI